MQRMPLSNLKNNRATLLSLYSTNIVAHAPIKPEQQQEILQSLYIMDSKNTALNVPSQPDLKDNRAMLQSLRQHRHHKHSKTSSYQT